MTSRFFTKPAIAIRYDDTGAAVILGRAESIPHSSQMPPEKKQIIVDAVEAKWPQIQAYVEARSVGDRIVMSRAAESACRATPAEVGEFVETIIASLE